MHDAQPLLTALTVVLCVAALTTLVFQRLGQPVVLGYILAGLIIGPHVPIPLVADRATIETLSELGIVLLMFTLGLEFNVRKAVRIGTTAGIPALVETGIMVSLGILVGRALGWTARESLFTGACVAISSTSIVAKAFEERRVERPLRQFVVGLLLVEDLAAVVLITTLTALASGKGLTAGALVVMTARLVGFLIGIIAVGMLLVPRLVRRVARVGRAETTLILAMATCLGGAFVAQKAGFSAALGAFLAGSLVGESGEEKRIEALIHPLRDVFVAIFFVSVGMMIDPRVVVRHWVAVAVLTGLVLAGKIAAVTTGAFLGGQGLRTSLAAGMSLAQIGEFSFIIAGIGVSLGAARDFLYPVAVSVCALTTFISPLLIRKAALVAAFIDRKLPPSIQMFTSVYGTWIERLRRPTTRASGSSLKRLARLLLLDVAVLVSIAIGTSLGTQDVATRLASSRRVTLVLARWLVAIVALSASIPLWIGIVRIARRMGAELGFMALPGAPPGTADLGDAPRRSLAITVQMIIVLIVGLTVLAVLAPFVPGALAPIGLVVLLLPPAIGFWRSAKNLQGHVRAGSQVVAEALLTHAKEDPSAATAMSGLESLLPGIGEPTAFTLPRGSPAIGRTLADLNLRGLTGATVLAIVRGAEQVILPNAHERLDEGDTLAMAGTHGAIDAAKEILGGRVGALGRPVA